MPQLTIEEEFKSRDGSARGVMGINEPRIFRVTYIHNALGRNNERTELTKPDPRGFVEAAYPYGSTNPWNGYSRAIGYVLLETLTHQTWRVRVDYGVGGPMAQTLNPDHTRWNLSARTVGISRQLFEEPTQALESWRNVFDDDALGPIIEETRTAGPMGTTKFIVKEPQPPDPRGADFWIVDHDEAGNVVDKEVVPTNTVVDFEYSDEMPGLVYTMTRTFANFKFNELGRIADYKKAINNTWFLNGAPGHVRCEDVVLDQVGSVIEDGATQTQPGVACRCSVSFLWSALPFVGPNSPLALVPYVLDGQGDKMFVHWTRGSSFGKHVEYRFPIRGMDFDSLIQTLESFGSRFGAGPIAIPVPR